MTADLDILLIARYVLADEILPRRRRTRRRPRITDAELVCLAVAQILLDIASALSVLAAAVGGTGQVTKQDGWARSPESVVVTVSGGWSDVDT